MSGIEQTKLSHRLQNLAEYTFYNISIAAESAIAISHFSEEVTFLTLCELNDKKSFPNFI
jgi:hypothetical protein